MFEILTLLLVAGNVVIAGFAIRAGWGRTRYAAPLKFSEPRPEAAVRLPFVTISRPARGFVGERGGSVYVWTKPFAGGNTAITTSLTCPPKINFELHSDDGVRIFLEEGLKATSLRIGLRRYPHSKLVVSGSWSDLLRAQAPAPAGRSVSC